MFFNVTLFTGNKHVLLFCQYTSSRNGVVYLILHVNVQVQMNLK